MEFMSMEQVKNVVSTLSLWDDGFFSKCMDGSTECASLMLSVILGRDDLTVESASAQKWLQSVEEHSAKLDVLAHDREGNAYDIEMQKDEKLMSDFEFDQFKKLYEQKLAEYSNR